MRKRKICIDVVTYRMFQKIEKKIEQPKEPLKSHFKVIKHYETKVKASNTDFH